MRSHRIRELREARGWSQERLASKIGRTKSVISRIEDGATRLDLEVAQKIADALDTTLADVLAIDEAGGGLRGLSEEFIPYQPGPNDRIVPNLGDNQYAFKIEADSLNKMGIGRGDIVIVDGGAHACKNPKPLQPVRVRVHPPDDFMQPVSLLLQFVPPSLLITNSTQTNRMPLDLDKDDVHIVGVVTEVIRRYA